MRRTSGDAADLRQEIHLQIWRSPRLSDGAMFCSRLWIVCVAHNTAASYVIRERRANSKFVGFEELERTLESVEQPVDMDRDRALRDAQQVILKLKPLDRQIIISYLEGMDTASIADITGLTPANIGMKIHRIKKILAHRNWKGAGRMRDLSVIADTWGPPGSNQPGRRDSRGRGTTCSVSSKLRSCFLPHSRSRKLLQYWRGPGSSALMRPGALRGSGIAWCSLAVPR